MADTQDLAVQLRAVFNEALNQLFREGRTHFAWLPLNVPPELLKKAYELAGVGPTSANSSPARFVFLTYPESKARLLPALVPGNVEETRTAPVTAIVAWDSEFYDHLPTLFPHVEMRSFFGGNEALSHENAFRNGSLQNGRRVSHTEILRYQLVASSLSAVTPWTQTHLHPRHPSPLQCVLQW